MFQRNNEKPQADAFVNNLSAEDNNGNVHSLGMNRVVLPLYAEASPVHKLLAKEAEANGGEVEVTLTAVVRLNTKKHGTEPELDPSTVSFGKKKPAVSAVSAEPAKSANAASGE